MSEKTDAEKSAFLKAVGNLRMIAFDGQSGKVITWGRVSAATSVAEALKILGYGKVRMQA